MGFRILDLLRKGFMPRVTGHIANPAWMGLLISAGIFQTRPRAGQRLAAAWAHKPPTNGARERARRVRQTQRIAERYPRG